MEHTVSTTKPVANSSSTSYLDPIKPASQITPPTNKKASILSSQIMMNNVSNVGANENYGTFVNMLPFSVFLLFWKHHLHLALNYFSPALHVIQKPAIFYMKCNTGLKWVKPGLECNALICLFFLNIHLILLVNFFFKYTFKPFNLEVFPFGDFQIVSLFMLLLMSSTELHGQVILEGISNRQQIC